MDEQGKQGNTVRNIVILVGGAFAALFVAMVVMMAVRGAPRPAVTYTMSYSMRPAATRSMELQARPLMFYSTRSELGRSEAPVALEGEGQLPRRSGLLPIRYIIGEAPIVYQTEGTTSPMPLYVPSAKVVLENADPKEKKK